MMRALFVLAAAIAAAACFSPSFNEGVTCGENGACPGGQTCNLVDNKCYSDGNGPTSDASVDAPVADAAVDAGEDPPDAMVDADPSAPDSGTLFQPCADPIDSSDCSSGEKCTSLLEMATPFVAQTVCVPDGTVPLDGACTQGPAGPGTGYDDCRAGGYCAQGRCVPICTTTPDSCGADATCILYAGIFDDLAVTHGLCQPTCDPLQQDCPGAGEGCYVNLGNQNTLCAQPADPPVADGQECNFINHCNVGSSCILPTPDQTGVVCAHLCDTSNPTCDPGLSCASIQDFYADVDELPANLGMCLDCADYEVPPCCAEVGQACVNNGECCTGLTCNGSTCE